jgi:hypothetical protein
MCALGKAEAPVLLLATQHIEICPDLELTVGDEGVPM